MTKCGAENMARSLGLAVALAHMRKALIHIQMAQPDDYEHADRRLICCDRMLALVIDQVEWAQGEAEEGLGGA